MLPHPQGIGHFITLPSQVRLHLVTAGDHSAPPLLMLHGVPEYWWAWRYQLKFFGEQGWRAIAPDLRGVNHSSKPANGYDPHTQAQDMVDLLDQLGHQQAIIIGSDYGGIIAYTMALYFPERVKGLVILNSLHPGAWPNPRRVGQSGLRLFIRLAYLGYRVAIPLISATNQAFGIGVIFKLLAHQKKAMPQSVRKQFSQAYQRSGGTALAYAPAFAEWLAFQLPSDLTVAHPTLVLWPGADITAPFWVTRSTHTTVPQAQVRRVEGAGHWLHQECPDEVNQAILSFLQSLVD